MANVMGRDAELTIDIFRCGTPSLLAAEEDTFLGCFTKLNLTLSTTLEWQRSSRDDQYLDSEVNL